MLHVECPGALALLQTCSCGDATFYAHSLVHIPFTFFLLPLRCCRGYKTAAPHLPPERSRVAARSPNLLPLTVEVFDVERDALQGGDAMFYYQSAGGSGGRRRRSAEDALRSGGVWGERW